MSNLACSCCAPGRRDCAHDSSNANDHDLRRVSDHDLHVSDHDLRHASARDSLPRVNGRVEMHKYRLDLPQDQLLKPPAKTSNIIVCQRLTMRNTTRTYQETFGVDFGRVEQPAECGDEDEERNDNQEQTVNETTEYFDAIIANGRNTHSSSNG